MVAVLSVQQSSTLATTSTPTFSALALWSSLADGRQRQRSIVVEDPVSVWPAVQAAVALAEVVVVSATVLRLRLSTHGAAVTYTAGDAALTSESTRSPRGAVDLLARRTL